MKKNVIQRNIERLVYSDFEGKKDPIEPMSEWKWNKIYQLSRQYGIGAWIADGIRCYDGDFFLNIPPNLRQKFMELSGEKNPKNLEKFQLQIDRQSSLLQRFSTHSLRAYTEDFIKTIQNIEE
jgi:hypothetical protein